jgi:thiol:disulfide interchange protein DsbC
MKNFPVVMLAAVVSLSVAMNAMAVTEKNTETIIKDNLTKALRGRVASIKDVKQSPIKGLYQVIFDGADVFYTDVTGNYLLQGNLLDLKTGRNLTEEEVERLTNVAFSALPIKDSFTSVRGNGKRKIAVFEDPNCGYCKRLDANLHKLNNVTIYTFLYPILGPASIQDAKNVWCAKDRNATWLSWMVDGKPLPISPANCDTKAIDRNVAWGKAHRVTGTPTIFFENGVRKSGALSNEIIEKYLNGSKS